MNSLLRPTGAAPSPKIVALAALVAGCLLPLAGFAADDGPYRFDFGTGPAAPGYVSVTPDMAYSAERGFGFEPNSTVTAVARIGDASAAESAAP